MPIWRLHRANNLRRGFAIECVCVWIATVDEQNMRVLRLWARNIKQTTYPETVVGLWTVQRHNFISRFAHL